MMVIDLSILQRVLSVVLLQVCLNSEVKKKKKKKIILYYDGNRS